MKTVNKTYCLLLLLLVGINRSSAGQSKSGIENYQFMGRTIGYSWSPVVHHLTEKGMYTEMRYNYEELKTASLYVGKKFNTKGTLESSFTPAAGIVAGTYTGASVALMTGLSYKNIVLSSQAQYTVSAERTADNFFYNWSDLYYMSLPWLFTGITMQQTGICNSAFKTQTGLVMGVTKGRWTIPVYLFNILNEQRFLIVGINVEWEKVNKK